MTAKAVNQTDEAPAPVPAPRPYTPEEARRAALLERGAYAAAGLVATVGPQLDLPLLHGGAVLLGAGTLWTLWRRTRTTDQAAFLTSCQRALPTLGLTTCYSAALLGPGLSWWEIVAPLATAALAGLALPLTRARGIRHQAETLPATIAEQAPAPTAAADIDPGLDPYRAGLARMWQESAATGATTLTAIHQYAPTAPDFEAVILAPPGQAVPTSLDERTIAAVFDVPVPAVTLAPVPGSGPGRLAVRIAPSLAEDAAHHALDPDELLERLWAEKIAARGGVAPGMHLIDHRIEADRAVMLVEAEEPLMIRLPRQQIARALHVEDAELVMIESSGLSRGVVTIYREHPLIHVREATVEDLTLDADGRIAIGVQHDGRLARMPLYDPELGAITDIVVGAPGSGKSVFLNHVLAAERINSVVSIVADAQNGMSLPEANGRVYHFGAGIAALGATLAAACAVGDHREQISAQNGWGGFQINDPWPLFNVSLDELNKVLGQEADVPREFKKWVTGNIAHFQTTGRKFGGGLRFAGQSIHVADLGDAEKIRANGKNGTVWLGRVNSTMTQSMAADMVTDGTDITPIPKHFGSAAADVEAAWTGQEVPRGPITAGRAWMFQGGRATSMRVFKAVKVNRTFPGLINLYESAPIPTLTPAEDEIFRQAYAEALAAAEDLLAGAEDEDGAAGKGAQRPTRGTAPLPPRPLADRILTALADGPRRTREIRAAVGVGEPDGPASGSVDNALSKLFETGRIIKPTHGTWALLGWTPQD
ncbi:hypothetical protein [Streptomyces sp. NPDC059708]|uniref:hypothetical protein n=1 Tax=Streptomyces sp. NPDC059708 TaxID=3346916 RepID=UPI0036C7EB6F